MPPATSFTYEGYPIQLNPLPLSAYATMDDSFREITVQGKDYLLFATYLANMPGKGMGWQDNFLVLLHPKRTHAQRGTPRPGHLGTLLAEFIADNLLQDKKLIACYYYITYKEVRPLVHEPSNKAIRNTLRSQSTLKEEDPRLSLFAKADRNSRRLTTEVKKTLKEEPYHQILEDAVARHEASISIGGVELRILDTPP